MAGLRRRPAPRTLDLEQLPVLGTDEINPNTPGRQSRFQRVQRTDVLQDTNRNVYLAIKQNKKCKEIPNDALGGINGRGLIRTAMTLEAREITRVLFAPSARVIRACVALIAIAFFASGITYLALSSRFNLDIVVSAVSYDFGPVIPTITVADSFTVVIPFVIGVGAIFASFPFIVLAIFSTTRIADALANRAMSVGLIWLGYAILVAVHAFVILLFNYERFVSRLFGFTFLIILVTLFYIFIEDSVAVDHNEITSFSTIASLVTSAVLTLIFVGNLLRALILSVQDQETYQWALTIAFIVSLILYWVLMLMLVLRVRFLVNFRNYIWALKLLIIVDNLVFYWIIFFLA